MTTPKILIADPISQSGVDELTRERFDLFQLTRGVNVIENALVLAAARRLMRPADALPLGTIRSLAYFLPVIEEVLVMRVSSEYFQHVRRKLERIAINR